MQCSHVFHILEAVHELNIRLMQRAYYIMYHVEYEIEVFFFVISKGVFLLHVSAR